MTGYYSDKLAADRLRRCYEIAPPRVRAYLAAEISHAAERIRPTDTVLELGCGYGRVLRALAERAATVVGIDTSAASLGLARDYLAGVANCRLHEMDATHLEFADRTFDVTICVQNGISAFHVDQRRLLTEALRVTRLGGRVLFSTYSARFWRHRLEWFQLQAEHGLIGEIDPTATGDGKIVCKDGFTATTLTPADFRALTAGLGAEVCIEEVDESSLFCELQPR